MRGKKTSDRFTSSLRVGLVLAAVSCLSTPVGAKGYMSAEFQDLETRPRKLALLPPHADFIKAKAIMTEEMVKECQALEQATVATLLPDLEARGYEVRYLSVEELSRNRELRDLVADVNERYDEEWVKMVVKPQEVRRERYQLGEDAVRLSTMLDVDALLISRVQAVGVTFGQAMMGGLFGGANNYARLDLSVIDGDDGEIEAYFYFTTQRVSLKQLQNKPDKVIARLERNCLKRLPAADEVIDVKVAKGADTPAKDPAEDAVMSEFLAILEQQESEDQNNKKDEQ